MRSAAEAAKGAGVSVDSQTRAVVRMENAQYRRPVLRIKTPDALKLPAIENAGRWKRFSAKMVMHLGAFRKKWPLHGRPFFNLPAPPALASPPAPAPASPPAPARVRAASPKGRAPLVAPANAAPLGSCSWPPSCRRACRVAVPLRSISFSCRFSSWLVLSVSEFALSDMLLRCFFAAHFWGRVGEASNGAFYAGLEGFCTAGKIRIACGWNSWRALKLMV